ncbi:hypothetical protein ABE485_10705 [Achromobacter spanius]|uniref:hypothetical protein n=1 Tax=Achromobacter spanius TaxID=217203 RepID=UPI00320A27E4
MKIASLLPAAGVAPRANPLAFATLAGCSRPFAPDMPTPITVAADKAKVHRRNDKPKPPGWVLDPTGQPMLEAEYVLQ